MKFPFDFIGGPISDSSPELPNGSWIERIIFSADIQGALPLYFLHSFCNPGEKESPDEFIKESLGPRSLDYPQHDLCGNESANRAGKTRCEECEWQTLLAAGEQGHRTVGLVRSNGKTKADRRFRRHCLH